MAERINKFLASRLGISRREADRQITLGSVIINGKLSEIGSVVNDSDLVLFQGKKVSNQSQDTILIALNKPLGYLSSRAAQGDKPSLYELLPSQYQQLKIAGRLDADSEGLVLLSNDGELINKLTHPSNNKSKKYIVKLAKPVTDSDFKALSTGVKIGESRLSYIDVIKQYDNKTLLIDLREGRNRQIRRTFEALGNFVTSLKRISIGDYNLGDLQTGQIQNVDL